jgi:sporulation protein YlmC with PRC-barrel domain
MYWQSIRLHRLGSVVSRTRGLMMATGLAVGLVTAPALTQPEIQDSSLLQERERLEAQEAQSPNRKQRSTEAGQQAMEFHTLDSLHGRSIVDSMNEKVGSIGDLIVDRKSGRIEYVVVQSGGFLSIGQREVAVDYDRLTFRGNDQTFVVPMSKEELQGMKEFDADTFLIRSNDQTWGQSISTWESENPGHGEYKSYDPYRGAFKDAQPVTVQGKVIAIERMPQERSLLNDGVNTEQNEAGRTPQDANRSNPQRTVQPIEHVSDATRQRDQARQEEQRRVEEQRTGQSDGDRSGQCDRHVDGRNRMQDEMVVMTVQTNDGQSHRVFIGPVWYVEDRAQGMQVGQNVIIQAVAHRRGDNSMLVARSVRVGDRELNIRDNDGLPAWEAEQVARDAARDAARWEQDADENRDQRDRREAANRRDVQAPDRQQDADGRAANQERERSWANQNDGMTRMVLLSEVVGREVSSMTQDDIGEITGAIIERHSGSVPFLVLNADQNFLGIGGTDRIVPWRAVMLTGDDDASISASEQVITSSRELPDDVNTLMAPGVIDQIYGNFSVQREAFQPRGLDQSVRNPREPYNPSRRTDGMQRDND